MGGMLLGERVTRRRAIVGVLTAFAKGGAETRGGHGDEPSACPSVWDTLRDRLTWPASITLCAVLPAFVLVALFVTAIQDDAVAIDFGIFYAAAESLLRLETPYVSVDDPASVVKNDSYVYPPLTAIGAIPLTALPQDVAGLLAMAALVCALRAILLRVWRARLALLRHYPPLAAGHRGSSDG